MHKVTALVATVVMLTSLASKGCEGGTSSGHGVPNMIANGNTKIIKQMIGRVYVSKGTTDSAKGKGLKCEWRIINADGRGDRFRIADGPLSVKFLPRNRGGVFHSRYCRMWILQVYS